MRNLLEYLLIHLVQFPEDVTVEEVVTESETRFVIHVNKADMGRVIGKKGSVIDAIRKIAKVRAVKEGIRAYVTVADEEEGTSTIHTESNETVIDTEIE